MLTILVLLLFWLAPCTESAVRIGGIETQAGYAVLQGEPLNIIESFSDLIYVIDEDRSPISSTNDSDESSDLEGITNVNNNCLNTESVPEENIINIDANGCKISSTSKDNNKEMVYPTSFEPKRICKSLHKGNFRNNNALYSLETRIHQLADKSNVPQNVLLQLIEAGHLEVHTEEGKKYPLEISLKYFRI
ncbi:uncharacterized protein LOC124421298 [Lucilia cuprina]|uniref:uncharacterized protein LOC124421298 n=1 Tax=Lucilia cuprina TaxID=7375 RepID=UPI001F059FBF|nr:uncharacterized protein LOC124421298 [Lucilia cuprina]